MTLESLINKGVHDVGKAIEHQIADFNNKLWKITEAPIERESPSQALGKSGIESIQGKRSTLD